MDADRALLPSDLWLGDAAPGQLVGRTNLHVVAEDAGNYLFTNHPLP